MSGSWLGPVRQISYTTDNLDRLIAFWETQVGVGPWSVFRGLTMSLEYEGRPIALPFDVALGMHGGVLIELMQINGPGPSPFHDQYNRPIIGLQRLASISDDIEADCAAARERGMEQFATGKDATGQRYVYFRAAAAPGIILELLENIPSFSEFFDRIAARTAAYRSIPAPPPGEPAAAPTPGTMMSAELYGFGGPELFRIERVPEPIAGPGQIRVRVAGAAVNPVDVKARRGLLDAWMPLAFPARLGGDVAGTVDAVGAGVTEFRVGDRVMGMVNPMANGAYAQKIAFWAAAFTHAPETLDLIEAAALPTGVLTGTQLIERAIKPRPGERVLVTGAGGSTGRAAVLAALDAGAIVFAGVRDSSRDAVRDLPVAGIIDLSDEAALTAAGPFDHLADTVGGAVAEGLFAHIRPYGVVASIAVPPPNPPAGATQRFVSLIVTFDGPRLQRFARDLSVTGGAMPIAHKLPLSDVALAHRLMEQGGVGGKIVLVP